MRGRECYQVAIKRENKLDRKVSSRKESFPQMSYLTSVTKDVPTFDSENIRFLDLKGLDNNNS